MIFRVSERKAEENDDFRSGRDDSVGSRLYISGNASVSLMTAIYCPAYTNSRVLTEFGNEDAIGWTEGKNLMKKVSILLFAFIFIIVSASPAVSRAATVYVSYLSLSPDPVYVVTGGAVYWEDGDDLGPYAISGGWGTFFTPGGVQFNVPPGSYAYTAESFYGGGAFGGTVIV